jgi:hypothetical protein
LPDSTNLHLESKLFQENNGEQMKVLNITIQNEQKQEKLNIMFLNTIQHVTILEQDEMKKHTKKLFIMNSENHFFGHINTLHK